MVAVRRPAAEILAVEAVVAVIKEKSNNASLQALTAAALLLPGLLQSPICIADDNEADFQYGHYQEGQRQLYGVSSKFDPIEVETLHGGAKLTLADRVKFAFNYTQDTWSGATPITTAPQVFGGNFSRSTDGISGATPYIIPTGGTNTGIFVDKQFNPLAYNSSTNKYRKAPQLVHTLSSASPETRKQGDFKLGYEWDEAAVDVGGGISLERDYESRFVNLGGRLDFNQKLTSLNLGLSYTNSSTSAKLDHDALPYIDRTAFKSQIETDHNAKILHGRKEDWAGNLSLTQVLNKSALVELGVGYTHSRGYMSNPYKVMQVLFVDPDQLTSIIRDPNLPADVFTGDVRAFLEQRPELRNQWNLNSRYVQHIEGLDAALHFDYRFYHDDWGINSHTFQLEWGQPLGEGWQITPRVRYYSQTAADFYQPYLLSKQALKKITLDENSNVKVTPFDRNKLPSYFSSDQRLSGYGALSGGVTISKKFTKGVSLEAGFEYYSHRGGLKIGGGGEGSYADFNYYTVNAALKVNLASLANLNANNHSEHTGHAGHADHSGHGSHAPAGVMFDHMLTKQNEIMLGYRYMYNSQGGDTLHGSAIASDSAIMANACGNIRCSITPAQHSMHMHMLDIMYAPTDWLNLMLMPQFMDMDMNFRQLAGGAPSIHSGHGHETGGIGDTGMYAMVKLFNSPIHHLHATLGFSAPTGDVDIQLRPTHHENPGFIHYGMQLGSGTWDFKPSLTYTGQIDDWSWGAQLSGTQRMEKRNKSGFAFGDIFQSTIWGGYKLLDWLSASVRGVYTTQGKINGEYNATHSQESPLDFPSNYGGQYWDVGFGLNAMVTGGEFAGNHLSFEWLQPVADKVNGYQLDREGALSLTWGYAF
jgi:hypothetical protein